MKCLYKILFLIFACGNLSAQMQTAHWYFGNHAGVDFSSGIPVSDNNGQIHTTEGSTSISDEYGNLLFYTDGETIYDRNHQIMENGNNLGGHRSSTTSAIIIPKPEDCFLYYVFTIDVQPTEGGNRGLEYNIVDMSENGGYGAVIENNIQIPINGQQQGYEKLAGISNADKTGYWVLTHFDGDFYAFEVNSEGVNLTPVVSPSSINPPVTPEMWAVGYLKGSPDGSKLAMGMTVMNYNSLVGSLSVYDFNNATGVVSNEIILYAPGNPDGYGFYAIEFSADSRALYTKTYKVSNLSKIFQYDLSASSIIDSEYVVSNTPMLGNAMQRALDGNIYISNPGSFYLSRIENPEIIYNPSTGEAPSYLPIAVQLESLCYVGLPTFLNHYFRISITVNGTTIDENLEYCTGVGIDFDFCHQGGIIESIHWDFGDGTESDEMFPYHYYNSPGTYTIILTLIVDGEEYIRTFEITMMGPEGVYNAEQEICLNEGDEHTFNLEDSLNEINPENEDYSISFHLTQSDAEDNVNPYPSTTYTTFETTTIWVRIEGENNCFVIRELVLIVNNIPDVVIESPIEVCEGTSVDLEVTTDESNTVNWYETETSTTPIFIGNPFETPGIFETTSYWVEIVSEMGCISERNEVLIEVVETIIPIFDFTLAYCINSEEYTLPSESDNGISGNWNPTVVDTGTIGTTTYTFTPNEGQCAESIEIEIEITESIIPEFNLLTQYCLNSIPDTLPTESDNGISGTWLPSIIDTSTIGTSIYTFTPDEGQCAADFILEIEITDNIIPLFELQTQYCINSPEIQLPTTSINGISGTWSPATIDTNTIGTASYTFTPDEEQCSSEISIEIEIMDYIIPELSLQTHYCQNAEAEILPLESDNGITGSWFPSHIDTSLPGTTTYVFTPDEGQCAEPIEIEIEITESLIPEFDLPTVYCVNSTPESLNIISDNGIPGVWFPSQIDTSIMGIQNYTFTPDTECDENFVLQIEITEEIFPEFNIQTEYCQNSSAEILPETSDNGISGNWSPSVIDTSETGTFTYTFIPDIECAASIEIDITISDVILAEFSNLPENYCLDSEAELLPTISDNGISGIWYPAQIDTSIQGTTIYTFTPSGNQCSVEYELSVTVYPHPEMDLEENIVFCAGTTYDYSAPDGFDYYTWTDSNGNVLSQTKDVTFTQEGVYTLTVEINGIPCTLSRSIEVSFSTAPVITEIKTTESTLTVYATGTGPFEYSLDNIFWQDSNAFYNLKPGIYFVYVRDSKGCGTAAKQGAILGVPNFISPNGDGINDTWKIRAIEGFPNTRLQIFDRYGKIFVDRMLNDDYEWNGQYNGRPLPTGSYWYILTFEDGEKLSGSISLRNY